VVALGGGIGVLINFSFNFNNTLWLAESVVHHVLIISHQGHFSLEFGVEVILGLCVHITLLSHSCSVAFLTVAEAIALLIVLTKAVVESLFTVRWVVHFSETS
jgi:hypothetical protein